MSDKSESKAALVENMESEHASTPRTGKTKSERTSDEKTSTNDSTTNGFGHLDDEPLMLPPALRRRVNALRKLQLESLNMEKEYFRRMHELECEFSGRMAPLFEKRKRIVSGSYEPTDEECDIKVPFDEEILAKELENQEAIKDDEEKIKNGGTLEAKRDYYAKGIEEFWLTALRNSECTFLTMEYPDDEIILKHLTDIEVKSFVDPMKFTLYFHFSPNEYFTNSVLTKEYTLACEPDPANPFAFEGIEVVSSKGCKIDWKEGKDVTMKKVTRMQKHKKDGHMRTVTKVVKANSFFNFFDPPVLKEGDQDDTMDEKNRLEFEADAELGLFFRDTFIPQAVLFYTGELKDDDEEYEEEEDEGDDADLEDENEDDEADDE